MQKFPEWIKTGISEQAIQPALEVIEELDINTVCQSARCPNIGECFSRNAATFMILGGTCTRGCGFCRVKETGLEAIDLNEPERVAEAVVKLGIEYAVITSVTRDDLDDGGAGQFVRTINAIKARQASVRVEVLVPDFKGCVRAIERVLSAAPDVFAHNLETAERLYDIARPQASYACSLSVLETAKVLQKGVVTKSGIMVGLGETDEEIYQAMRDLRGVGCDILTIGQYLKPGPRNLEVKRFVSPEGFAAYERIGHELGFKKVASGPMVRSSYRADYYN